MSGQCLVGLARGAVGHIDLAVACTPTDQETGLVAGVFQEADVPHCPVMHRQLDLLTCHQLTLVNSANAHSLYKCEKFNFRS